MNTSLSTERRAQPKGASSSPTEYAWVALVIGAIAGALLGHFVWHRTPTGAAIGGTIGYLIGALIDRARR